MLRRVSRTLARILRPSIGSPGDDPKFIGYLDEGKNISIRPAPPDRNWMSATPQRFAYRCLPLTIANCYGWEMLCDTAVTAIWDGGEGLDAIVVESDDGETSAATSHFGNGVLTFAVPCLFTTDPEFDLVVQGPINHPKDAIAPLTGIVETGWSPYTFTMNWLFTRHNTKVRFEKGEPFCHIFPLRRRDLERFKPELRQLTDNPQLKIQHDAWRSSRAEFNSDLRKSGTKAVVQWQKLYHHGLDMEGRNVALAHRTKVRVKSFKKRNGSGSE
jgi:hypothetical protein